MGKVLKGLLYVLSLDWMRPTIQTVLMTEDGFSCIQLKNGVWEEGGRIDISVRDLEFTKINAVKICDAYVLGRRGTSLGVLFPFGVHNDGYWVNLKPQDAEVMKELGFVFLSGKTCKMVWLGHRFFRE